MEATELLCRAAQSEDGIRFNFAKILILKETCKGEKLDQEAAPFYMLSSPLCPLRVFPSHSPTVSRVSFLLTGNLHRRFSRASEIIQG